MRITCISRPWKRRRKRRNSAVIVMDSLLPWLPHVNATLNASAAVLLVSGWLAIHKGNKELHRWLMLGAVTLSGLFLTSYLFYHSQIGSKHYTGVGMMRIIYFSILISHTVLAIVIVPLIGGMLYYAAQERWSSHRKLGQWTMPLWFYVSVTGVVVYFMLYQFEPPA